MPGADHDRHLFYASMYFGIEIQKDVYTLEETYNVINNIYLNGVRIAAMVPTGEAAHFHTDQVDSVKVVTNDAGAVVSQMEYLPYGETWFQEGDDKYAPKYNSQELDKESGYYFYNARYYDPQICRFVTADNVIDGEFDTQGWNRYSYCKNNPIRFKDPTGHKREAEHVYSGEYTKDDGTVREYHVEEFSTEKEYEKIFDYDGNVIGKRYRARQKAIKQCMYITMTENGKEKGVATVERYIKPGESQVINYKDEIAKLDVATDKGVAYESKLKQILRKLNKRGDEKYSNSFDEYKKYLSSDEGIENIQSISGKVKTKAKDGMQGSLNIEETNQWRNNKQRTGQREGATGAIDYIDENGKVYFGEWRKDIKPIEIWDKRK